MPPGAPRLAMLRMNTPASSNRSRMRMRSPKSAPPLKGLLGSTEMMATVRPRLRACLVSAAIRVLLPLPGAPVTPTT